MENDFRIEKAPEGAVRIAAVRELSGAEILGLDERQVTAGNSAASDELVNSQLLVDAGDNLIPTK